MTVDAERTDLGSRPVARKGRRLRAFLRNPTFIAGLAILAVFVLIALFAGLISPGDPQDMVAQPLLWPGDDAQYPLGTDSLGRDVLA
jgi:peptide/nickel transport system permease protein